MDSSWEGRDSSSSKRGRVEAVMTLADWRAIVGDRNQRYGA